jgi:hypothetical protein
MIENDFGKNKCTSQNKYAKTDYEGHCYSYGVLE